jgi:DNA invertase Pin-like site-specific DNA recombinase
MAVYGYVRVSTNRQADEGESHAVQQRTIAGYAHMHGWQVANTFRIVYSFVRDKFEGSRSDSLGLGRAGRPQE